MCARDVRQVQVLNRRVQRDLREDRARLRLIHIVLFRQTGLNLQAQLLMRRQSLHHHFLPSLLDEFEVLCVEPKFEIHLLSDEDIVVFSVLDVDVDQILSVFDQIPVLVEVERLLLAILKPVALELSDSDVQRVRLNHVHDERLQVVLYSGVGDDHFRAAAQSARVDQPLLVHVEQRVVHALEAIMARRQRHV